MATVLITGGTGTIGKAITKSLLGKGYTVIILTRGNKPAGKTEQPADKLQYAQWDIEKQTIDITAVAKADYIIHLAGAGVADKRWTKKRKQEIVDSRVKSGTLLVKTLQENKNQVKAFISASAIGWYGADPVIPNPHPFDETDPAYEDFLGNTCKQWEASVAPIANMGKRLVYLRTGIVLSKEGGALKEFLTPLRFGIAAILSNGRQIISWIHIDDIAAMYIAAMENEKWNGVYNAVAPKPVSNKDFTLQLGKSVKGKFFIPIHVPSFILKIALGEMSIEVLKSTTVSCTKVQIENFSFHYPDIETALK